MLIKPSKMKFLYLLSLLLCLSHQLFAQAHNHGNERSSAQTAGSSHKEHGKHSLEPPHGGELINVGKYYLEVVLNVIAEKEKFSVYLLKPNMKTIDAKSLSGKAVFRYKGLEEITYEFENDNPEKLYCNVEDIVNEFVVVINIKYKGKEYSTVCEYAGLTEHLKKKN